ncbi:MAG: VWA domain-containing protein [Pirellulales bacterium]
MFSPTKDHHPGIAMASLSPAGRSLRRRRAGSQRRGIIIVLTAILLVFMLGMIAFAVDVGYIANARTEIQRATDSAAYAGAGALVNGTAAATTSAQQFLVANKVAGTALNTSNSVIEYGFWDTNNRTFTVTNNSPNAIRVRASASNTPLFFGNAIGKSNFGVTSTSIATYQPRDIGLVLDYSGSMCYDSQFRNINLLGQSAIEANLQQIWQQLGSPKYGTLNWSPVSYGSSSTSNSRIKSNFKLNTVSYPYPGGSWDEFIDYVQSDNDIQSAGYRNKYGMMTFLSYVLEKRCGADDTPGLHVTSEQPITALKDAVDVFLSFLSDNSTDDRVSLSIYTFSDNTAKLEQSLTKTYTLISNVTRNRQAGHYIGGTNISAGMTKARVDLQNNARAGAKKMMVLMTDGVVNLPSGNTTSDKNKVIQEANLAAGAGIPIVTIALGAYADTALMQQVADITGGAAFIVPGGQPITQVQAQLEQVFQQVAADRPLKLVQ